MSAVNRQQAIAEYEQAYTESNFEVVQASYRKKMLLELLDSVKPKRVLEIGCGWDTIANHWSGFEQLTIVEPGAQFAAKARQDVAALTGASMVEAFVEEAAETLQTHSYDLILLSGLLHEVPDPALLMQSTRSLCGPDTLVHVNVPNAKSMHRLLALEMGLIESVYTQSDLQKSLNQPRIFDLDQLESLVTGIGFKVVDRGSLFMKLFTHAQMMSLVNEGKITAQMLDGLWALTKHFPENGSEIYVNLKRED
ncbi:MAG: class I SAM-dependent methyltransferase [Methylophilus sp.]|uniref:class I SAM-dependent methyltransferase n=1 Tax=Methylophilus sp. TaxID=29541 RepID=UPI003F9F924B